MRRVVFVDVETGGLDPRGDALLEIGSVSGCGEREFQAFVWPEGRRVCEGALRVNGIDVEGEEVLEQALSRKWAAAHFSDFLASCGVDEAGWVLAGMNPSFDRAFLMALWRESGEAFPKPGHRCLDLHSLACGDWFMREGWAGEVPAFYSDAISECLAMEPEAKPHRALAGAKWARECAMRFCCAEYFSERGDV